MRRRLQESELVPTPTPTPNPNPNPNPTLQAVHRAYRYGQSRPVYIYRLIAEGLEQCLYRQQARTLPPEPEPRPRPQPEPLS